MSKCEQPGWESSKSDYSNNRASPLSLFVFTLSEYEHLPSHVSPPISFFVKYFNNVIIIVIFVISIINILWVSGIPWVLSGTTQIMVQYVPIPVTGMVFVGMSMVWEIPTCSILMKNPTCHYGCIAYAGICSSM